MTFPETILTTSNFDYEDTVHPLTAKHCARHSGYDEKREDASPSSRSSSVCVVFAINWLIPPHPSDLTSNIMPLVFFPEPLLIASFVNIIGCNYILM